MTKKELIKIVEDRIQECTVLMEDWLKLQHELDEAYAKTIKSAEDQANLTVNADYVEYAKGAAYYTGRIASDMKTLSDLKILEVE